ncbi:MAG: acylphosphatase [Azospirillaceae bacterium]
MTETDRTESASDARKALRLSIAGRVQGVAYRAWTVDRAVALGLDGWVRNRPDGTVEALAAGPPSAVDALVDACRDGPPAARVTTLDTEPAEDPGPVGFRQVG